MTGTTVARPFFAAVARRHWQIESLKRIRKRHRRCYELAAWIELDDGRIYDAVKDSYEPAEQYMARNEAIVDHRYSQREMCHLVSVSGNAGPCTDDEREAARIRGIRITDMERTQS